MNFCFVYQLVFLSVIIKTCSSINSETKQKNYSLRTLKNYSSNTINSYKITNNYKKILPKIFKDTLKELPVHFPLSPRENPANKFTFSSEEFQSSNESQIWKPLSEISPKKKIETAPNAGRNYEDIKANISKLAQFLLENCSHIAEDIIAGYPPHKSGKNSNTLAEISHRRKNSARIKSALNYNLKRLNVSGNENKKKKFRGNVYEGSGFNAIILRPKRSNLKPELTTTEVSMSKQLKPADEFSENTAGKPELFPANKNKSIPNVNQDKIRVDKAGFSGTGKQSSAVSQDILRKNSGEISTSVLTNLENNKQGQNFGELKFLEIPAGGGMTTPDLKIGEGYFVFTWISSVVAGLQTSDFPAALLRDWILDKYTLVHLIIQVIRVEGGIIACIAVFLVCALALPIAVLTHVSCRFTPALNNSPRTPPLGADLTDSQLQCRKLALLVLLDLLLLLLPGMSKQVVLFLLIMLLYNVIGSVGLVGMFLSNEHLGQSMEKSPVVARAIFDDVTTFVRNTHLQIRFVATTSMDQAVDSAISDIEDVEDLLGRPIQRELATETGVDVALDALLDICSASTDIVSEVLTLRAEAQAARETARTAQERLKELKKQVETTKKQCIDKDKILCDTVDTMGLEVVFSVDKLLAERKLSRLRHLGDDNLTTAAEEARFTYQKIPKRVVEETFNVREEIKRTLRNQRDHLYSTAETLDNVSRDFSTAISNADKNIMHLVRSTATMEYWRWITGLGSSLSVLLIWAVITSGAICAHANCAQRLIPTLLTAIALTCLFATLLWTVASAALLIGGNGELLMCRPLYDDPNYATLTLLLDNPGMVYKSGGLFSNVLQGNDKIDVPIKSVLSECRLNQPSFPTFNLNKIFNIDTLTNHLTWPKLHKQFSNLSVTMNGTEILKPTLQKYLQDLSQASRVNLTFYRSQMSGSVTGTDLNTFADHLERVANQMSDLTSSARMETLASRCRKLGMNNLQRLEKHRDEIVYKLTALEVHLLPLQKQANQSLSHLKTIQYYLNNQGTAIAKKKTNEYVARLINYLERFREYVLNQLTYEVAPCRPIWDTFHVARKQLCRNLIEPTNGFFMSLSWCLLILSCMTPILMLLIEYYRYMLANGYLQRDLNELLLAEQGHWATAQGTPESMASPEESSWTTPRRQSEQFLIPRPRRTPEPSISPSFRQLVEAHMPSRPRPHESLRMIEPSTWRNHTIPSPRGWL